MRQLNGYTVAPVAFQVRPGEDLYIPAVCIGKADDPTYKKIIDVRYKGTFPMPEIDAHAAAESRLQDLLVVSKTGLGLHFRGEEDPVDTLLKSL